MELITSHYDQVMQEALNPGGSGVVLLRLDSHWLFSEAVSEIGTCSVNNALTRVFSILRGCPGVNEDHLSLRVYPINMVESS